MISKKNQWWEGSIEVRKYERDRDCKSLKFYAIAATIVNLVLLMTIFCTLAKAEDTSEIAIQTIARESSNQPFEAQVAVASVIKTRMAERKQTAEQVVKAPYQFSCWNKGTHQKPRTQAELATARKAWMLAKAGSANLYHDTSVLPSWAKSKKVTFLCRIGKLMFYQEVRRG